jgi:hypothetical protein
MKYMKHKKFLPLLLAPLLLAGCGDGWTTQAYHGTPYDRTAGSGVEYVRAHMAPPATLNTESQTKAEPPAAPAPAPAAPAPAPAETKKGDAVFHKAALK